MLIPSFKRAFAIMVLSGVTLSVCADDAPVFDVDSYPPQFDGQSDAGGAAPSAVPQQPVSPPLTFDQRMLRIEQQVNNLQHADSASKLSAVQTEVQSLHGQVDELTHQLKQMQTQQQAMYSDLDKRLNKRINNAPAAVPPQPATENKPVAAIKPLKSKNIKSIVSDKPDTTKTVTPSESQNQKMEQDELAIYQTAYDLIKDKKYDEAIAALQKMLQKYPSGQFAANAHFWLGELYGLQNKNDQAAVEFENIVKNYPDSSKVSDARVKLGMIYAAQFKWAQAKSTFKTIMKRYPGSTSAHLAAQQLRDIKAAGH